MAMDRDNALVDLTGTYLNQKFREQSWFKENSNTVTAAAGLLATLVAWLASQPFAVTPGWQTFILIAGFALSVVGVKVTPNGFSKSQMAKVNAAAAKTIGETSLVEQTASGGFTEPEELDRMVQEYLNLKKG